jgi:hypothetical protein
VSEHRKIQTVCALESEYICSVVAVYNRVAQRDTDFLVISYFLCMDIKWPLITCVVYLIEQRVFNGNTFAKYLSWKIMLLKVL